MRIKAPNGCLISVGWMRDICCFRLPSQLCLFCFMPSRMENRARPLVREMGWGRLSLPCLFVQKQGPKSQGTQSDACTQTVTPPFFFRFFFVVKDRNIKTFHFNHSEVCYPHYHARLERFSSRKTETLHHYTVTPHSSFPANPDNHHSTLCMI